MPIFGNFENLFELKDCAHRCDALLNTYCPISLGEMEAVRLLRRSDTKYLFSEDELLAALGELQAHYDVLEVEGKRVNRYETVYFDQPKLPLYFAHHSRKVNRHKVRIRKYVDSGLVFLEVKLKRKGQTDKRRLPLDDLAASLSPEMADFIASQGVPPDGLRAVLRNRFERMTFVDKARTERLTLDRNLTVAQPEWGAEETPWPGVCIAELKQSGINRRSAFAQWTKARQIRPERISKYVMGLSGIRPSLKANRFKSKQRKLLKLMDNAL